MRGDWVVIASTAAALVVYYMFRPKEHLENPDVPYGDTAVPGSPLSLDTDETRFSEYGNISMMSDVDSTYQRRADLVLSGSSGSSGKSPIDDIDNSDVVDSALLKHSSLFLPAHATGVTPTSSAYMSNFTLGEPDPATASIQYTVPLDDSAFNLDQALARGQQHRASINKRAIDGAVRATKNLYKRVFGNELAENENREWWSSQSTDFETDFRPYY